MERERQKPAMDRNQLFYRLHELKGALLLGALLGSVLVLPLFLYFPPWRSWRLALAAIISGAAAGAAGSFLFVLTDSDSPAVWLFVLPLAGAVGGATFWLFFGPSSSIGLFVLSGVLIVPILFLVEAVAEMFISRKRKENA
jgi:hypothetical protein